MSEAQIINITDIRSAARGLEVVEPRGEDMEPSGSPRCDHCVHFMSGYLGQYCRALCEDIFSIHEAQSCDIYEEV